MESTPPDSRTRYLTCLEAAAHLKLSPSTLEKMRTLGSGPPFRKCGRRVLYALSDLDDWAESRACSSTSDQQYQLLRQSITCDPDACDPDRSISGPTSQDR
jgi:predicted DNA-binding transcriptional regulator AlpA